MHALSPCKGPIGSVFNFINISLCALCNNRQSMETQSDNKSNTCAFMKFNVSGNFDTSKNTCFKQVLHDYVAFSR